MLFLQFSNGPAPTVSKKISGPRIRLYIMDFDILICRLMNTSVYQSLFIIQPDSRDNIRIEQSLRVSEISGLLRIPVRVKSKT